MGLDKVIEEILHRGEEEKLKIISLGETERDDQIRQADKKIADERVKAEKRGEVTIAQMEQQELSSAELESKKALLVAQRKVMDNLKEDVLTELRSYPAEKRKKLYSKLVSKAKKEFGECFVYTNKTDKALLQLPPGIVHAGVLECAGGLIFESKDRNVRLDFRFESMLDEVWNKNMQEIYSKLFG
jgi:V/A-type H+-transporting ATPase subunit E